MKFSVDNNDGTFEVDFEPNALEKQDIEMLIDSFIECMFLAMANTIKTVFDNKEKAQAFSMLTLKSMQNMISQFIEEQYDEERIKEEAEAYKAKVNFYEQWLEETASLSEEELLKTFEGSETLLVSCDIVDDMVYVFFSNEQESELLTKFTLKEAQIPEFLTMYSLAAMDVFHVFSDRLYKGKYNPVREYDCNPMDIVEAVNKLLGKQAL